MLNYHLPLECKTISDWHEQVKRQAYKFREKYERSVYSKNSGVTSIRFYKNAYNTYAEVEELLSHLTKYKRPSSDHCLSCRHTPGHADKLEKAYQKYYPQLMRCRDGFHYSKEKLHAF